MIGTDNEGVLRKKSWQKKLNIKIDIWTDIQKEERWNDMTMDRHKEIDGVTTHKKSL